jgi:hypothetical protein
MIAGLAFELALVAAWQLVARIDVPTRLGFATTGGLAAGTYLAAGFLLAGESVFGRYAAEIGFGFCGMVGVAIGVYTGFEITSGNRDQPGRRTGADRAQDGAPS